MSGTAQAQKTPTTRKTGLLMDHPSLGVGIGGGQVIVAFDVSDAVAKSGDYEEAGWVGPAETDDLSGLRGRIAL